MGIKTALAGITLTAGDITQAETIGTDAKGEMLNAQLKCQELTVLLNYLITDVLTPAGDSSNVTTLNTQITALA